jgi:tetratricopeptide (TPR) repeat protein
MPIDPRLATILGRASGLENRHLYGEAEAAYREAVAAADPADRSLVGTLYINVGNAARAAGRADVAIASYRQAAELLADQRGESFQQRGYALFNLASLLLDRDDPEATTTAAECLRQHRAYPYTGAADLVDAALLDFLARLFLSKEAAEPELRQLWSEVRQVPCAELTEGLVLDFGLNYLLVARHLGPAEYARALAELQGWALPPLFARIVRTVDGGGGTARARRFQGKLRR